MWWRQSILFSLFYSHSSYNRSLTNINNSKKTYLRLVLPNVAADAKAVCDYINKNYLLGQISPVYTVEFDAVAANADWFSGVLSTDSPILIPERTVWGFVQQRTTSAENSTLYKYFAGGTGGAGSVSPFKRYEDGYNAGYAAGQSELHSGAPVAIAFANNLNCKDTSGKDVWLTWNANYFYKSGITLIAKKTCQLRYVKANFGSTDVSINNIIQSGDVGSAVTINAGNGIWIRPKSDYGSWSHCIAFWVV